MKFAISKNASLGRRFFVRRRPQVKEIRPVVLGGRRGRVQSGARVKPAVSVKAPATLAARCGIAAVLIYFVQTTVLAWYLHLPGFIWSLLPMLILGVTAGVLIAGGGSWRWLWVLVLLSFGVGVAVAEQTASAGLHWLGIVLLFLAVGPVIMNPQAIEIRAAAWGLVVKGLTILTGIFFFWYALHLPNLGGQIYFTAFTNQSMVLGAIAGMGVTVAAARALHGRSWRWGVLAVLGLVPLLASGSRLATLATCAAGCFLLIRRKPVLGITGALLVVLAVVQFMHHGQDDAATDQSVSFTDALAHKGTENSRADLWQSRIEDFKSSPLIGVGIGMGSGEGIGEKADGSIQIEPGSSYLAILSMTGALGFVVFFTALGVLVFRFAKARSLPPLETDILSVIGIYLGVHGVAEGWILGCGHPFCFLFWLWLGNVGDAGVQPGAGRKERRTTVKSRPVAPITVVT